MVGLELMIIDMFVAWVSHGGNLLTNDDSWEVMITVTKCHEWD